MSNMSINYINLYHVFFMISIDFSYLFMVFFRKNVDPTPTLPHDFLADGTPEGWQHQCLWSSLRRSSFCSTFWSFDDSFDQCFTKRRITGCFWWSFSPIYMSRAFWFNLTPGDLLRFPTSRHGIAWNRWGQCPNLSIVMFSTSRFWLTLRRGSGTGKRHCPQSKMPPPLTR